MRHDRYSITFAAAVCVSLACLWCAPACGQPAPVASPQPVAPKIPSAVTSPTTVSPAAQAPVVASPIVVAPGGSLTPPPPPPPLRGLVDLHTHPMASLAFGGKLLYGGVDGFTDAQGNPQGSLLPADPSCQHNVLAADIYQALGHDRSTHGGPIIRFKDALHPVYNFNPCGNALRAQTIHAVEGSAGSVFHGEDSCGLPYATGDDPAASFCNTTNSPFGDWPTWDDVTHQKMWVDWIMRAYAGGLRVMVALATNNKLLGDAVTAFNLSGTADLTTDDVASADLQIAEIKRFVGNHSDWMQVAYSSQDVYNIVAANKLAIVIGVEIDQIGDFKPAAPPSDPQIRGEIDRLYGEGVRYVFPVHLVDSVFGGTAAYDDMFNVANLYEDNDVWHLTCANNPQTDGLIKYQFGGNVGKWGADLVAKLQAQGLPVPLHGDPSCGTFGQKNSRGLNHPASDSAFQEMMHLGMLIDVDHMSQQAVDETLALVSRPDVRYPVMSGHNAVRGAVSLPGDPPATERNFRADQYAVIGALHGMAGVGNAGVDAWGWMYRYYAVIQAMCNGASNCAISAGFGTDTDGLVQGNAPPTGHPKINYLPIPISDSWLKGYAPAATSAFPPILPMSSYGRKTWDYNAVGFAHYGLLPDFVQDARNLPPPCNGCQPSGTALVDYNLMNGADYFYHTWQIAEARGKCVFTPACVIPGQSATAIGGVATVAPMTSMAAVRGTTAAQQIQMQLPALAAGVSTNGPSNSPVTDVVTVTSGGSPVAGATVSVSGQSTTVVTNATGVAVISHAPCYTAGSQVAKVGGSIVPVRIPTGCGWTATASAPGYQSISFSVP